MYYRSIASTFEITQKSKNDEDSIARNMFSFIAVWYFDSPLLG